MKFQGVVLLQKVIGVFQNSTRKFGQQWVGSPPQLKIPFQLPGQTGFAKDVPTQQKKKI